MRRLTGLTAIFSILALSQGALALESFDYYRGVRGLGMGGASIAVVNDETSLVVNPAGLNKLRDFFGTVFDPEIETNNRAKRSLTLSSTGILTDVDTVADTAASHPDTYAYSRTQLFPSLVVRNFGIGVLYTKEQYGIYDSQTSTLDLMGRTDTSFVIGYGMRFWGGRIKLGINGKYIQRAIVDEEDLDLTTTPAPSSLARTGTGVGADAGLILTAPWVLYPTMAVVVRDIGNTKFKLGSGTESTQPLAMEQSVDVALAATAIHNPGLRSQWTVEYKNALNPVEGANVTDLLHSGVELNYADAMFWRAGYYHKSWTAGAEFSTQRYQVQLASYAPNVGTAAQPVADRRYVVKVAVRF